MSDDSRPAAHERAAAPSRGASRREPIGAAAVPGTSKPQAPVRRSNHPDDPARRAEGYALRPLRGDPRAGRVRADVPGAQRAALHRSPTRHHGARRSRMVNDDPNQYLFYTDTRGASTTTASGRSPDKAVLTRFFSEFLLRAAARHRPLPAHDVPRLRHPARHEEHAAGRRRSSTRCTSTLPICHRDGQMVRTHDQRAVPASESPRRCHECFPDDHAADVLHAQALHQVALSLVDLFIAPSEYVRDRYVDWGIPAEKIWSSRRRLRAGARPAPDEAAGRPRNRFAFFGQFTPYKGADVLLEAMELLGDDFDGQLWIHGANLENQPEEFQEQFKELLEETPAPSPSRARTTTPRARQADGRHRLGGRALDLVGDRAAGRARGLPARAAGDLQRHRRHVREGRPTASTDCTSAAARPDSLAEVMHTRRRDPGLWDELRAGIPPVPRQWTITCRACAASTKAC